MPRYFFQVSGDTQHADREGRMLVNDQAAWSLAITSMGELLRDLDGHMPDKANIVSTVTNERGAAVISLRFTAERNVPAIP